MRSAFTLVELAIVLIVAGLMAAFGLMAFSGKTGSDCYVTTEEQLKAIDTALQNFAATHQRLPKPANVDLGSSATEYGYEATGSIGDPLDPAYGTNVPTGMTNAGGVLIGALPHVTLGLENSYSGDCWGQKFTYAVTNALTGSNPAAGYPGSALGTITLKADSSTVLSTAMSYVVLSHGQDQFGATAVSAADTVAKNCNGSAEPKLDVENCNSDATFMNATRNTGDTGNYFDDLVIFKAKLQSTEPCAAQGISWLSDCSGNAPSLAHSGISVVNNVAPAYVGAVTVTCQDSSLTQSAPSCTPGTPATCASEGLGEGQGNYDGACNLTSCCGGTIVGSILPDPCPNTPYMAGAGQCSPTCDSDGSDGKPPGEQYCTGVLYSTCNLYYSQRSPDMFFTSCDCSDDATMCESGSATLSHTGGDTSGCPPAGVAIDAAQLDCHEEYSCICN